MKHSFSALVLASLAALTAPAHAGNELAGYDRLDVHASHRADPIAASIWYPVGTKTYRGQIGDNIVFKGTFAYVGAAIEQGKHPLVLLSHGSGGNMDSLGWLSSELALRGAIVLSVNHPGSTSGDSSPRRTVELGKRAKDLTAALDQVLSDPSFAAFIDTDNITSSGFSLGGATALNLAGIRFDRQRYANYCAASDNQSADCVFFAKGGVTPENMSADFETAAKDARVSRTIAFDPGFTSAATTESMTATDMPTLFISLGDDNLMPGANIGPEGSGIVKAMPNAERETFAPAHHFTFLAECKPEGAQLLKEEADDPVCDDPEGTDRGEIHARIIDAISRFLNL